MYFSLDVDGRLVTFNDTLVVTLGYQREELARRPYTELLAPSARADWDKSLRRDANNTLSEEAETLWRTSDGAILDVWIRSVRVLDEEGKFVRYRSAALDLTERPFHPPHTRSARHPGDLQRPGRRPVARICLGSLRCRLVFRFRSHLVESVSLPVRKFVSDYRRTSAS